MEIQKINDKSCSLIAGLLLQEGVRGERGVGEEEIGGGSSGSTADEHKTKA